MRDPLLESEAEFEAIRGDSALTMANFIRWERIKLHQASREAIALLESAASPTREYLDYMFNTDIGFREIRARIAKHQARLAELETLLQNATP